MAFTNLDPAGDLYAALCNPEPPRPRHPVPAIVVEEEYVPPKREPHAVAVVALWSAALTYAASRGWL